MKKGPKRPQRRAPKAAPPISKEDIFGDGEDGVRLNKYVAHCGVASRRKAGELIEQGLVQVNGTVVREIGHRVQRGDQVTFKGKPIKPEVNKVYILLNKPKNTVTTLSDERGRRTVMDIIGNAVRERIYPVGRLDRATTGLLLLTNDGDLARKLSHPSEGVTKFYHVVLDQPVKEVHIRQIADGLMLEDGKAIVDKIDFVKGTDQMEVGVEIHMGKNRIVRRLFEHFGYEVKRLDRTYYAGLTKKDLPRGRFRHLSEREVIMLKHFS